MSQTSGKWLREQRQARGWGIPQMRRELRDAATAVGDKLPANDCLSVMIHRWEDDRSGIGERYRLHYCRAFGLPSERFGQSDLAAAPKHRGAGPDIAGSRRANAVLAGLFPDQVPLDGGELHAAVQHLRDPANRDVLCFMLGYASAMTAVNRTAQDEQ